MYLPCNMDPSAAWDSTRLRHYNICQEIQNIKSIQFLKKKTYYYYHRNLAAASVERCMSYAVHFFMILRYDTTSIYALQLHM